MHLGPLAEHSFRNEYSASMINLKGIILEDYDIFRLAVPHHDALQATLAKEIGNLFGNKKIRVLDLGVGTGLTSRAVLKYAPNTEIIGVDLDVKMTARASTNIGTSLTAVAEDLNTYLVSEKPESFDAVVSAFTIHNLSADKREKICKEVFRVLKPGGIFVNADKIANNKTSVHKMELSRQLEQFSVFKLQGRPDLETGWTTHYLEDEENKLLETEWESDLQSAMFTQVEKILRIGMEAVYVARKKDAAPGDPLEKVGLCRMRRKRRYSTVSSTEK